MGTPMCWVEGCPEEGREWITEDGDPMVLCDRHASEEGFCLMCERDVRRTGELAQTDGMLCLHCYQDALAEVNGARDD